MMRTIYESDEQTETEEHVGSGLQNGGGHGLYSDSMSEMLNRDASRMQQLRVPSALTSRASDTSSEAGSWAVAPREPSGVDMADEINKLAAESEARRSAGEALKIQLQNQKTESYEKEKDKQYAVPRPSGYTIQVNNEPVSYPPSPRATTGIKYHYDVRDQLRRGHNYGALENANRQTTPGSTSGSESLRSSIVSPSALEAGLVDSQKKKKTELLLLKPRDAFLLGATAGIAVCVGILLVLRCLGKIEFFFRS